MTKKNCMCYLKSIIFTAWEV